MTPLQLFLYSLAVAGGLVVNGLVLLGLRLLFYAAVAPPLEEEGKATDQDGRLSDEREVI